MTEPVEEVEAAEAETAADDSGDEVAEEAAE